MFAARPIPDSSMPPCQTGIPCDAHRSCSRIDSAKPPMRPGLMLMMRQAPAAMAAREMICVGERVGGVCIHHQRDVAEARPHRLDRVQIPSGLDLDLDPPITR